MELDSLGIFWSFLKVISIPAALKLYVVIQSFRIYGVYNLYRFRHNVFSHSVFSKLDRLYTDQELFNRVSDITRREVFKDIYKIEVSGINDMLLAFREEIYKDYSFFNFMYRNKSLDCDTAMSLFLRLYNAHRDKLEKYIKISLRKGGIQRDTALYLVQKYYEYTDENSFILRSKVELLRKRNNLYYVLLDLFDRLEIEIDASKFFLPLKFSKLNGELDNISYKGNSNKDVITKSYTGVNL